MHSTVISHFEVQNILTVVQHGFRKARSCESQLISTVQDLANSLNNRQQIDTVLLDFSKVFDKVPHKCLLHKLRHYRISGSLLEWIRDFLTGSSQEVILEGEHSVATDIASGVP